MQLSTALFDDLPEILRLQKECYQQEALLYQDDQIPPLRQDIASLQQDFKRQTILKVVAKGMIIASVRAYLEENTCSIGRLIVHKDWQNQGLGTQLMKAIEMEFSTASRYELFTGHKSEKNLYLYRKLGYQPFKQIAVNERLEMVFLEKENK